MYYRRGSESFTTGGVNLDHSVTVVSAGLFFVINNYLGEDTWRLCGITLFLPKNLSSNFSICWQVLLAIIIIVF